FSKYIDLPTKTDNDRDPLFKKNKKPRFRHTEPRFILLSLIKLKNYGKLVQKHVFKKYTERIYPYLNFTPKHIFSQPLFFTFKGVLTYEQKT
ncbi:hypothetical protein COL74_28130, partial [Bacillus wiedmannii]